jgi:hypothetical protein
MAWRAAGTSSRHGLRIAAQEERRARATAIIALLSGAVSASRTAAKADPALADCILMAARDAVDRLTA